VVALADAFASYNPAGDDVDFGFLPPCAGLCRCFRSVASASALVTVRIGGENGGADHVLGIIVFCGSSPKTSCTLSTGLWISPGKPGNRRKRGLRGSRADPPNGGMMSLAG
jgi:hypothetical protein